MKKIVVFGGSGFLGSHVADALSKCSYDVHIFDKEASEYLLPGQNMIIGDIQNERDIDKAVKGAHYVYHFAAIADILEAQQNPIETVAVNVLSTVKILQSCVVHGVKRFIYGSTVYVYSNHGSFYRSSKQSAELFIENYQLIYGLDYTILRFGSLYGKRANSFNFINNIIDQALTEKKIERKGDGGEIREYINVLDAARASVEILVKDFINANILITGTQAMLMKDLLNMIKEMFNDEIDIIYLDEIIEEHYQITPYSFQPKVAKKYILNYYHDLGQGILECIYDNYKRLYDSKTELINFDLPKSLGE
jgi:UDP-glucose 4-epimerase